VLPILAGLKVTPTAHLPFSGEKYVFSLFCACIAIAARHRTAIDIISLFIMSTV
jgi:hypothetical protein